MSWYLAAFRSYANFSARSNRPEYWYFVLFSTLASWACIILDRVLFHSFDWPLAGLYSLATVVPQLALQFRRLHDTGRTGWALLWVLLPIVGWIVLLVFLLERGGPESNPYGPPRADWHPEH